MQKDKCHVLALSFVVLSFESINVKYITWSDHRNKENKNVPRR